MLPIVAAPKCRRAFDKANNKPALDKWQTSGYTIGVSLPKLSRARKQAGIVTGW